MRYVAPIIMLSVGYASALIPCRNKRSIPRERALWLSFANNVMHYPVGESSSLHMNRENMNNSYDPDNEDCNENIMHSEQEDLPTPPSTSIEDRIKKGNYLDILPTAIITFFLGTLWLSGGRLIINSASTYSPVSERNARIYKVVDADSILRDDFDRESSKVIF